MTTDSATEAALDASPPPAVSNRQFVVALAWSLIALAMGALIVIGLYVSFSPMLTRLESASTLKDARAWKFDGSDLTARIGTGKTENGSLRITGLQSGQDERAIFSRRTRLKAADYPFLESTIEDRHPGAHIYFIWRTERAPEEVFYVPIQWANDGPQLSLLASHKEWRGTITEIGIDVYGDLREQGPLVRELILNPSSRTNFLSAIVTEWTAFRNWTQKSAHHLRGTPSIPILSPTVATAAWVGVSLLLILLLGVIRGRQSRIALTIVVAIPWISLDLLWQGNLNTQIKETRYLFAGKDQHEKHLSDRESELYRYIQYLKGSVLPAPGVKIYLMHDSERRGYRRLRAQQYLLPHNVYNFGKTPPIRSLRSGDYILVLDSIPEIGYQPTGILSWGNSKVPASLIDKQELGQLYQVGE
ncbi:hypothetical protein EY643_01750 [Halioglobus maricola]|uniref:Uncharacterized protein n=1 Tax=Halioglobus maricola TaxID=2601894 RepID=A0A5P9NFC8_9GAMM|nr:hypothetical protein [Halioglobus maricola]QFU74480.1 hypothetical protein EY643_01750 [Halioglobus maricola]